MTLARTASVLPSLILSLAVWLRPTCSSYGLLHRRYACIIDAGSSKSKIVVYRWIVDRSRHSVPDVEEVYSHKVRPGISAFGENVTGLEEYMTDLIHRAKDVVPSTAHPKTSLFLLATAGMRLLLEYRAHSVMENIRDIFSDKTINPFSFQRRQVRILSGEEEGAFAWITVNYLRGFFSDNSKIESTGILEMGGASTQIAFIPEGPILADKFPVKIGGKFYGLYVHSYLSYGARASRLWLKRYLAKIYPHKIVVDDPCMLKGDVSNETHFHRQMSFRGSGNANKCANRLGNLVYKSPPSRCFPKPCAIGQIYQPKVGETKRFIAISSFIYAIEALKVQHNDGMFSPDGLWKIRQNYCSLGMAGARNFTGEMDRYLSEYCFMANYIPMLLTKAFGFQHDHYRITAVKEIDGRPTDWAIGALLYELERSRHVRCNCLEISGSTENCLASATNIKMSQICFAYLTLTSLTAWAVSNCFE